MRFSVFRTFGTYLLLCSICEASENLIPVHRKGETWNTLITNGGFEADKLVVVGNRGSLLNVVPTGWKMAHGVSLIAYKSFPKFLQDHAGEIYLAMQSISGFLAQEVSVQSGKKVKLSFSVLSYCLTAECVQNGVSVYTSSSIPVQPETSKLVYQYISNEMNVWLKKSIAFIAPSDQFNVSFYAFSDGPRSSGLLIDNIELVTVEEESPYVPIEGTTAEPSVLSTFAPTIDTIPIVGNLSSGEASSATFVTKPAPKPKPGPLSPGSGPGPKAPPLLPGVMVDKKPQNPFSTKHEVPPPATSVGASLSSSKSVSSADVDNTLDQQVQNQLSDEAAGDGNDVTAGDGDQSTESSDESITSMANGGISTTETASNAAIRVVKKKSEETLSGCPLRIELLDSWGDGWHGAYLSISNAIGVRGSNDYGISTNGIVSVEPHANVFGRSSWQGTVFIKGDTSSETMITIADVNKRVPREAWEIFWVVTLPDYSLFVGNYESELALSCHLDAESDGGSGKFVAKFTQAQKPVEDDACTKCPQGDHVSGSNQEESLHHQSLLRDFTTIGFSGKDVEAAVLSAPQHSLKRKSRKLNHDNMGSQSHVVYPLSIDVLNSAGRGWFNDTLVSTFYTISDSTRTHLLAKGTLCGRGSHDNCVEALGDGDYVFRVTGNLDSRSSENSWEFCGLRGSAQQELTFSIKSGQCVAGHLTFAVEVEPEDEEEYDYEIGEKMKPIRGYDSSIKFDIISSGSPDNEAIEITHKSSSMKAPATATGASSSSSQSDTDATDSEDSSTFLGTAQAVTQSFQSAATDRFDALRRGEIALEDCVAGIGSIFVLAFIVTLIVQRRSVQTATACVNDNATACVNDLPLPIRKKRVRFMLGVSPSLTYSALGQTSTEPLVPRVDL